MFQKPCRVKSSSHMKGSDKKKLKAELRKRFGDKLDDDAVNALVPAKEEVLLTKLQTASDGAVLAYVHNKTPLFFELDKEKALFPTVYALWRYPALLPAFPTWPPVVKKIANGADLMLPGVVVDQELGMKAYYGPEGKLEKVSDGSILLGLGSQ